MKTPHKHTTAPRRLFITTAAASIAALLLGAKKASAAAISGLVLKGGNSLENDAKLSVNDRAQINVQGTLRIAPGGRLTADPGAFIEGLPGTEGASPQYKYAIFQIPLGGEWTDFELKGSRTNFSSIFYEMEDAIYFLATAFGDNQTGGGQTGRTDSVYFTDSSHNVNDGTNTHTRRRWRLWKRTCSIFEQRRGPQGIIGGAIVIVPVTDIIHPKSYTLIWSYQRVAPNRVEDVWIPILPQWITFTCPFAQQRGGEWS